MKSISKLSAFLIVICWTVSGPAGHAAFRRVAIISSPEMAISGLGDVTFARLAETGYIELVERDRIDLVFEELGNAWTVKNEDMQDRIKIGSLLNADGLVFLSELRKENAKFVKAVITDCRHGVRLSVRSYPFQSGKTEEAAEKIVRDIKKVKDKYARGISHVVGVSPFVSKNLIHDYNHLQAGYAFLLESALAELPGVAVIETEEALAIGREMTSGTVSDRESANILFVSGEFRVEKKGTSEEIRMTATIAGNRETREEMSVQTLLNKAPEWIGSELFNRIGDLLRTSESFRPSRETQSLYLKEQAQSFANLGLWEKVAGLGEAALLLDPNSAETREKLVYHYVHAARSTYPTFETVFMKREKDAVIIQAGLIRTVNRYLNATAHLENLIRNRRIDFLKAVELLVKTDSVFNYIACFETDLCRKNWWPEQYERAESTAVRMINDMPPLIRKLERELLADRSENLVNTILGMALVNIALSRAEINISPAKDIERLGKILSENRITYDDSEDFPLYLGFVSKLYFFFAMRCIPERNDTWFRTGNTRKDAILDEKWLDFIEHLKKSDNPVANFLGKYCSLEWIVQRQEIETDRKASVPGTRTALEVLSERKVKFIEPEKAVGLLAECDGLLKLAEQLDLHLPWDLNPNYDGGVYARLKQMRGTIAVHVPGNRDRADIADDTAVGEKADRIVLEPIEVRIADDSGHLYKPAESIIPVSDGMLTLPGLWGGCDFRGMLNCGSRFDAWWGAGCVFFMKEKGVAKKVFSDKTLSVSDVAWDGEYVWAASRKDGLRILGADGEVAWHIAANSLPPAENGFFIHGLSAGRLLAAGGFGDSGPRGWCAEITFDDPKKKPKIKIFHEAVKTLPEFSRSAPDDASGNPLEDPAMGFEPQWIFAHEKADGRRILLVGRRLPTNREYKFKPLAIDPDSLSVSVMTNWESMFWNQSGNSFFSRNGELFEATGNGVLHWKLPDGQPGREGSWNLLCSDKKYTNLLNIYKNSIRDCTRPREILNVKGWLYVPADEWWRINLGDMRVEKLGICPTNHKTFGGMVQRHIGWSAHYGLIAWLGGASTQLFKITVD